MEIKDINVSVERLEEVRGGTRGGQHIDVVNLGLQVGGNTATSQADSWGIGNSTAAGTRQLAGQSFAQDTRIAASDVDSRLTTVDSSIIGFGFRGLPL